MGHQHVSAAAAAGDEDARLNQQSHARVWDVHVPNLLPAMCCLQAHRGCAHMLLHTSFTSC